MRKALALAIGIMVPIVFAATAGALVVIDQQGVPGAYYGGIYTTPIGSDPTYAFDLVPSTDTTFSVNSFAATNVAGGMIQVTFTGPYFGSDGDPYNNPTGGFTKGRPGDLYLSTTGWVVATNPGNHGIGDTFNPATEGWNVVVPFLGTPVGVNDGLVFTYTNTMHNLDTGKADYQLTMSQGFTEWRVSQAWRGGYGDSNLGTVYAILNLDTVSRTSLAYTVPAGSLTFIFPNMGLSPDALGYHWTQGCGNDVVEGGVPIPSAVWLLGSGLIGLIGIRRRFRR